MEVPINECIDIIPDYESLQFEIAQVKSEMEEMEKEIMGEYYHYYRLEHLKNRRSSGKRNKERDKRYREYKRAVKDLEEKLAMLKEELEEAKRYDS